MTDEKHPEIPDHQKKGSGKGPGGPAAMAIIIVLIIVVAGLAYLDFGHQTGTGSSATVTSAAATTATGSTYNYTVHVNGKFKDMTVYFGDHSNTTVHYSGTTNISVSHVYRNPGNYYIYYSVNFVNSVYEGSGSIVNVVATEQALDQYSSNGLVSLIADQSSTPSVNHTTIFSPGSQATFLLGYYTEPSNSSFQVVSQSLTVYKNGTQINQMVLPYAFNSSQGVYILPETYSTFQMSNMAQGYYSLMITTYTAEVNNTTTGSLNMMSGVHSTTYFVDMPVFKNAKLYQQPQAVTVFVNDQVAPGGYTTLDPAINYDLLGYEILDNTDMWLLTYNQSSATSYVPALATQVPTISNGGINNNYANYTQTTPWGTTYTTHLQPYENFTFHVRSNASFQNGQSVTAWDVMYSLTRTLLFDGGVPGTPGWIQGQYLLPGDIYSSNTFYNITNNMTVNNASNSITFHFQTPMPAALVFEILDTSGSWITSAQWLAEHGANITWTPQGFENYKVQGNSNHYNAYIEGHILADGPYKVSYITPSSQVVLVANPSFTSPGPWYPKPSINEIIINYISQPEQAYLAVKAGQAQGTSIPTANWAYVQSLNSSGAAKSYGFPSLGIYWYSFNANVNMSILTKNYVSSANMPGNMFSDLNARKAFSYAFNYNDYLNNLVGNAIYHSIFGQKFAGALPQGMLYAQTLSDLNNSGAAVPYYSPSFAKQYWDYFLNSSFSSSITMSGGNAMYNGKQVVVPVFIRLGNPSDFGMFPIWADEVQNVTGVKIVQVPVPAPEVVANRVQGQNPMPIALNDWYPDYPYPTDYLAPIALPTNGSTFIGPSSFTPYWINGGAGNTYNNQTEANILSGMVSDYNNGSTAASSSTAQFWFQKMNEQFVNMTLIVPLQQKYQWRQISPKIDPTGINTYEKNIMVAGDNIMLYTYLSYT